MNRRFFALALALAAAALALPALAADTYVIDKSHTEATFRIRHMMSSVSGRFRDIDGTLVLDTAKPTESKVDFKIGTASIDTANENRDKHLRSADFFDVEKNPEITFQSTKIVATGKDQYDVTGNFTMHGVTRTITLPVKVLGFAKDARGGERVGFEVQTTLDRKDYGLTWNRALEVGSLLGDEVAVTINIEANRKKPE
jgi:polyisoprenoid-binding protein YceI